MKDLTKNIVVKEFLNSIKLARKHYLLLLAASIIDILFLIAWGFFTTPVQDRIVEHAVLMTSKLSEVLGPTGEATGILSQLMNPAIKPLTGKLIILVLILFVVIYLVYSIFQGSSWWFATKIAGVKLSYRKYMLGFFKINLIWIAGFILYKFLDLFAGLRHVVVSHLSPGTPDITSKILLIPLVILFIAAFLSYPKLNPKQIIKTKLSTSLWLVLMSVVLVLAAQFILNAVSKLNIALAIFISLFLLYPLINIIKICAARVILNVHSHN